MALVVSACVRSKPKEAADGGSQAEAVASATAAEDMAAQDACRRVKQEREDCYPGKPCAPNRMDDFLRCHAYLQRKGLSKNPY